MSMYRKVYTGNRYANHQPVPKFMSPDHIQGFCTADEAYKLVQHLNSYSGKFSLMIEMRDKFNGQNGYKQSGLSEKQWGIVRKNMHMETPAKPFTPVMFLHPCDIVVNKTVAYSHFKKKLGMKYGIFTLRVHSIKNVERSRGGAYYKITMDVSPNADGPVSACRVCGKALTDHTSITTGIGPTCAKKIGATKAYKSDVKKFMEEVKKEFQKVGVTEITTWDSYIVQGSHPIMAEINNHFNKAVKIEHVTVSTEHVDWLPYDKSFVVTRQMDKHSDVKVLYDVLKSNEVVYVNLMNPKTTNWVKFKRRSITDNKHIFDPCDKHPNVDSLIVKL